MANALVALDDGAYLELVALRLPALAAVLRGLRRLRLLGLVDRRRRPFERRFIRRIAAGPGLADFALSPAAMGAVVAAARGRGLAMSDPEPGRRERPDGQVVRWLAAVPATPDVPFLCADVTPPALRVPDGPARRHPNGAIGVASVAVAVRDLAASRARYVALGLAALSEGSAGPAGSIRFATTPGSTVITLVDVEREPAARGRARAEGPRAVVLRTAAGGEIELGPLRGAG